MLEGRTRICQNLSLFANFNSILARKLIFSQQEVYLSTNVAVLFLGRIRFVTAGETDVVLMDSLRIYRPANFKWTTITYSVILCVHCT
jgi:hypothetical protein